MTLEAIRPADFPWFRYEDYTFSLGLREGLRAWLSGHSASRFDPTASRIVVTGDMAEQARTAYAKVRSILDAAGLGPADVVRVVENVTLDGMADYHLAEQVRAEVFGPHQPAVATVAVDGLLRAAALFEVEVNAVGGGGTALAGGLREDEGTVYLPTVLPVDDDDGRPAHPGDLVGQYRLCLQRVRELLGPVGLDLGDVVKVVAHTGPMSREERHECARIRREMAGSVLPAVVEVTSTALHRPGVVVALDVVASRHSARSLVGDLDGDELGWSPAVAAGRLVHFSAASLVGGRDTFAVGDVATQARLAYRRLNGLLADAGLGPEHLVITIEYVSVDGLAGYRKVAGIRQELLRSPFPASTGVVCRRMPVPGQLLEVDATALIPDNAHPEGI